MNTVLERIRPATERVRDIWGARGGPGRLIGLDIDAHQLKLVVLERKRGGLLLKKFRVEKVDAGHSPDSDYLLARQRRALYQVVESCGLKGQYVVANLPYYRFSTRLVILPKMPARELRKAIHFETRKFSTLPLDESVVDYVTVDEFNQEGTRYGSHLVIVINRESLARTISLLRGMGLKVHGLGVTLLALRGVLARVPDVEKGEVVAALDIGRDEISFSMVRNGRLVFARDIPGSGHALTESITSVVVSGEKTVELDYERAEQIKVDYGILDSVPEGEVTEEGIPLDKIAVMMRPVLERMLTEIQRSIDFCQEQFGLSPPDRMFLSGGGSKLKNFREFLSRRLRADVVYLNPLESLTISPEVDMRELDERRLEMVSSLGFAMNVRGERSFILPEEFREREGPLGRTAFRVATIGAVLAVTGSYAGTNLKYGGERAFMERQATTLAELQRFQSIHKHEALQLKIHKFKRRALLKLLGPDVPLSSLLKDLSHRLGTEVQLTKLEVVSARGGSERGSGGERIRFHGLLCTERGRLESLIANLLSSVNRSPFFYDVRLEKVHAVEDGVAQVDFSCGLVI